MIINYRISAVFVRFTHIKRCFSLNTLSSTVLSKQGKKFLESENEYAHSVFLRLPQYKNSVIPVALNAIHISETNTSSSCKSYPSWEEIPISELCNEFKNISVEAKQKSLPIANECFNAMCKGIARRSSDLSDENLLMFLYFLSLWPQGESPKENNFYVLWKSLDNACLVRWKTWDIDKILLFSDLWYNLHLARQSDFVYKSITKAAMNPSRLLPHQLVQLLFYLNIMRTVSKGLSMFEVHHKLGEVIRDLSIEEIGIAVMGFFKTRSVIHSENLMDYIINRIINEATTVPEITLASLLKALRGSITIPLWERIPQLMDVLETQIDRLSLQCSVHINLLATKCLFLHEGTLTKISQKLVDSIKAARLKDMEKVIFPLTYLNFNPHTTPCLIDSVVKEIIDAKRANELRQYPKSFVALVYYLTLRNIFVEEAIVKVLDMGFIRQTFGRTNFMIGREILGIDAYVDIVHPEYTGPRLPTEVRNYLSKRYSTFMPDPKRKLSLHAQFTLDVLETTQHLFGENCITYKYVLPHHSRADIVLHLRPDGEPHSVPDDYRKIEDFTGPIKAPHKGTWIVLVIASRNMFVHNVPIVTGETSSKLDLLKLLGYKPVLVSFWNWPNNREEKITYLKKLIYS